MKGIHRGEFKKGDAGKIHWVDGSSANCTWCGVYRDMVL